MKRSKGDKRPSSRAIFYSVLAKRLLIYTLAVFFLFLVAYILDRFIHFDVVETVLEDGTVHSSGYTMFIPLDILAIGFVFLWLIGIAVIFWKSWMAYEQAKLGQEATIYSREQLQRVILRRYQRHFWGALSLYTLILALIAAMLFLIQKSRIWYATDPLYPLLKMVKQISPFAAVALWAYGIALILYRQWRQSASDVVGLIGSIEQMQGEQAGMTIGVPETLPEVQPVVQDIYDRAQESRRTAKEAERRKDELVAYLAHDLKTPLTSVMGYLDLLVEQPEMPAGQRAEYTRIAQDKAMRLENLINQFFEISRYNAGELVIEKAQLDLKYLLLQMADEFFPILAPQGKRIVLHAPDSLLLNGDAGKLARVFNNIIRNAATYSEPDTAIEIDAISTGTGAEVSIKNVGKPIPQAALENVFGKFFRLDDARSSDSGGAGLGLAIAQEIVLRHGGAIRAESGEDSVTITVVLPG